MSANLSTRGRGGFPEASPLAESANSPEAVGSLPRLADYLGIFSLSASVLLFELALTRIFSVILWSNLAFMVVSTALFGFGLSGVFLALRPSLPEAVSSRVSRSCCFVGISIIAAYLIVNLVPFEMWKFHQHPEYYLYLAIWELALLCPFFFAGLAIASILGQFPHRAARLYGIDLLGAAGASILLLLLITPVGGEGMIVIASLLALLASGFFSTSDQRILRLSVLGLSILLLAILPNAARFLPLSFHSHKRGFAQNLSQNPLFETRWSSLSRVDIGADQKRGGPLRWVETLAIWIDGGTNNSVILKWDGDLSKTPPMNWLNIGLPYELKKGQDSNVMIIGSAGGREVLFALTNGAGHIDAVEMDPSTVHFVHQAKYADYMGHLYQHPKVSLINDEGRAYLMRQPKETYDVIQSVNNYTPVAMAAGALNLSETFLFTKEAFHEYFDHLKPNGIIAFHRGAALRVALTAVAALRERGVEHPENHIIIANGDYEANQTILIKKSAWTEAEGETIDRYLSSLKHYGQHLFLWTPLGHHQLDPFYANIMLADAIAQPFYYTALGLNLAPTTDDRPFLEHFIEFGRHSLQPGTPPEFLRREAEKWLGVVPRGDFPYVAILAESAILATIFLGLPLIVWSRDTRHLRGFFGFIGFFASLGFSFIAIEICLMKRYVLFLGHPAYSISTVILMLLCGAGVGSILNERINAKNPRRALTVAIIALSFALLIESQLAPLVFEHFLHLGLPARIAVASALLFPLGVLMGMPFTLGVSLIAAMHPRSETQRHLIAWAWGINGYTTVIGSAGTVFIALFFGFTSAIVVAAGCYVLGLLAILRGTKSLRIHAF